MNFPFNTQSIYEIFLEEYGFSSVLQITPSALSALNYMEFCKNPTATCCLVIDSGFSFTHVSHFCKSNEEPFIVSEKMKMKRLDVGGKLLTNQLKEIISYRQLQVMEETYVMNQVKEDVCFISLDFLADMKSCSHLGIKPENPLYCEYILPDFQRLKRGFIKRRYNEASYSNEEENHKLEPCCLLEGRTEEVEEDFQSLHLTNEVIAIPEILFNPSDIGLNQMGLPELIVDSCTDDDRDVGGEREMKRYLANVVLTGGNVKFKNFERRLLDDLRKLTPSDLDLSIYVPDNPDLYAWQSGALLPLVAPDLYDLLKLSKTKYFAKSSNFTSHTGESASPTQARIFNTNLDRSALRSPFKIQNGQQHFAL